MSNTRLFVEIAFHIWGVSWTLRGLATAFLASIGVLWFHVPAPVFVILTAMAWLVRYGIDVFEYWRDPKPSPELLLELSARFPSLPLYLQEYVESTMDNLGIDPLQDLIAMLPAGRLRTSAERSRLRKVAGTGAVFRPISNIEIDPVPVGVPLYPDFCCSICRLTQSFAPENEPGGITVEEAITIGWQAVHPYAWLCPEHRHTTPSEAAQ